MLWYIQKVLNVVQKGKTPFWKGRRRKTWGPAAATPVPVSHPSPAPTHQPQVKSSCAGAVFAMSWPCCLEVREEEEQQQTVQQLMLEFALPT